MALGARCYSLRPDRTSGWLAYFELVPRGSRAGHFLVVGPAAVRRDEDVRVALRAGQAAVRYLKEVPSHAPPLTLLEATARILDHESAKTETVLEFGCAVLDGKELWLLTRGGVRLVPLAPERGLPFGAERPHAVAVDMGARFFLGRVPAEKSAPEDLARLEHGAGGDGGLILQLIPPEAIHAVEGSRADAGEEEAVEEEITFETRGDDRGPSQESPVAAPRVPETVVPSPEHSPPPPKPASPPPPSPDIERLAPLPSLEIEKPYPPGDRRGLGFWLAVVAAAAAIALFALYLAAVRPWVRERAGNASPPATGEAAPGAGVPVAPAPPATVWEERFTQPVTSSPLLIGDKVIFGCRDGRVYALARSNGARCWAYVAEEGFGSSPAGVDGALVIGGYDGKVYALEAASGAELWVVATRGRIVASPAVSGGTAYVGSYDHSLYAIAIASGKVRWRRDLGAVLWSSPVCADRVVVVAGLDGRVSAVDTATGRVAWRAETGGEIYSSPAAGEGKVFVGSKDGKLYAFAAAGGARAWTVDAGGAVNGSPAYGEGWVLVGTESGDVLGIEAATGRVGWRVNVGGEVRSRPAFAGETVWLTSYDGFLRGIDWKTGREVAKLPTGSSAFSSPAIGDGIAYFGALDGRFLAVRLGPGAP